MDELTRIAVEAGTGDRLAQASFVRRTLPEVHGLCRRLGDPDSVEDLVQEVYLRALPALARFRGDASARTWLLQVARNVCADHVRRRTRRRRLIERVAHRTSPADAVDHRDLGAGLAIDEALAGIDPHRREAFVLTQLTGLSYAEAAEVCGVPVGTIRSRVARARADLLARLAGDDDTGAAGLAR